MLSALTIGGQNYTNYDSNLIVTLIVSLTLFCLQILLKSPLEMISDDWKKKMQSRQELRNKRKKTKRMIKQTTGDYFSGYPIISNLIVSTKCIKLNDQKSTFAKKIPINQSLLLYGDAGSGKSTLLKRTFLHKTAFFSSILNCLTGKNIVLLSVKELFNSQVTESLSTNISNAKYHQTIFIIDNFDESYDVSRGFELLLALTSAQKNGNFVLVIGCRSSILHILENNNLFRQHITKKYRIEPWSEEDINRLIDKIFLVFSKSYSISIDSLYTKLQSVENINQIINYSPLRCKMLCITLAFHSSQMNFLNTYQLYEKFFEGLIKEKTFDSKNAMLQIGLLAFKKYQTRTASGQSQKECMEAKKCISSSVLPIVFCSENNEFHHRTYEEFFLAYYYISLINIRSDDVSRTIEIFKCNYINSYSDFIADGIRVYYAGDRKKAENLIDYYIYVYYFTILQTNTIEAYKQYFLKSKRLTYKLLNKNQKVINSLNKKELLFIKYEITFRVGRVFSKTPIAFLNFVYFHDDLSLYRNRGFRFSEYENAILRRQCAISLSLLCDPTAEIDYVKKILDYDAEYNPIYDLVNRTHTLIYYEDVVQKDLFNYTDDLKTQWTNARNKRIKRLQETPKKYNPQDRIACFRLFDLATIYSFLACRGETLLSSEIKIIKNTVTIGIDGNPPERENLMNEIKEKILRKQSNPK